MKSVCRVYRNPFGPARFTGNYMPWISETPDGRTYCECRESARNVARRYNREREALLREGIKTQARIEFYD
jgi:hypothetical protein